MTIYRSNYQFGNVNKMIGDAMNCLQTSLFSASFDGDPLTHADQQRLERQLDVVREYMLNSGWRTLSDIERVTGYPQGSISARLRDLRKEKFGGYTVQRQRSKDSPVYIYRVIRI